MQKDILCLAFSKRDGGHCFAGIDLETNNWLRPVSPTGSGELHDYECRIRKPDGTFATPRLLDIMRIDLQEPKPSPAQPENWVIGKTEWKIVGRKNFEDLAPWIRHNKDPVLFRNFGGSVSVREIARRGADYSLTLIRPQKLIWKTDLSVYRKKRVRGLFSIGQRWYDLPVTDEVYERNLLNLAIGAKKLHNFSTPILLTLSLGEPWQGAHYKLIAGVITHSGS